MFQSEYSCEREYVSFYLYVRRLFRQFEYSVIVLLCLDVRHNYTSQICHTHGHYNLL